MRQLWRHAVTVGVSVLLLGVLPATEAHAALSVTTQHCSTTKVTCIDQTVDNGGEVCFIVKQDASHKANLCVWDHSWQNVITGRNVNGRAKTCVAQCFGVDHFHWANEEMTLWRLNNDGSYTALRNGSPDIPSLGDTGPSTTVYATDDYQYSSSTSNCYPPPSIKTHTEVQVKVFWTGGGSTSILKLNSDNFCHS